MLNHPIQLVLHEKRSQWGAAILANEGGDRRTYQFEDGQKRTFAEGYYHFLKPADRPMEQRVDLVRALKSMLGRPTEAPARTGAEIPWNRQAAFFRHLYAEGFAGEAWTSERRSGPRRVKRHRDALVADAKRLLSKKRLSAQLAAGEHADIVRSASEVLSGTDLVTPAERRGFAGIGEQHAVEVAEALFGVLHGEGPFVSRFARWLSTLKSATGEAPGWELATVLPAAVHPSRYACVKATLFDRQAQWMAPGLVAGSHPVGGIYQRLCTMAKSVRGRLEDEGLAPRDLFDVRDYMWETLRPAALRELEDLELLTGE